jgi:hypothetical protein
MLGVKRLGANSVSPAGQLSLISASAPRARKVSRCESILCLAPGLERKKRFDGKPERIMDAGSGPRPLAYVRLSGKTGCELIPIGQDLTVHTLTAPKRVD